MMSSSVHWVVQWFIVCLQLVFWFLDGIVDHPPNIYCLTEGIHWFPSDFIGFIIIHSFVGWFMDLLDTVIGVLKVLPQGWLVLLRNSLIWLYMLVIHEWFSNNSWSFQRTSLLSNMNAFMEIQRFGNACGIQRFGNLLEHLLASWRNSRSSQQMHWFHMNSLIFPIINWFVYAIWLSTLSENHGRNRHKLRIPKAPQSATR